MIIIHPTGAPECCRSEREFLTAIKGGQGIYLTNLNIAQSGTPGALTREVDGVLITPAGICTVEVKGVAAVGELSTPSVDAWTVTDGDITTPLYGRPHIQALTHSKYLASLLKAHALQPGWVAAVLVFVADRVTLPENAPVHVVENVRVLRCTPTVLDTLNGHLADTLKRQELSLEAAQDVLATLGCVTSAPAAAALLGEGFRPESVIRAEIEEKRHQARAEYLAVAHTHPHAEDPHIPGSADTSTVPGNAHEGGEDLAIADGPSTLDWRATEDRYRDNTALDPDLTETGAFIDGVAMHRRLVAYAARKNVPLGTVAAVVNNPCEVLGDPHDPTLLYCGTEYAVTVRTIDGMAILYRPIHDARAERDGVTIDGVEITARAAKQARGQHNLTFAAVARLITAAEERWWVPGTTDVAHARGDFVAVTAGPRGPVQYVSTRSIAVARAAHAPRPTEHVGPTADQVHGDITVKASAVGWCIRRGVAIEAVTATATNPQHTWPGHSPIMEVRAGDTFAVLFDTTANAVIAVMTPSEAAEYRDGLTRDGVHLTGRCVYLARRRKVSLDRLAAAVTAPVMVARAPGAVRTVYVGVEEAVYVDDVTGSVEDFTSARHARAMVRRSELVRVDGHSDQASASAPLGHGDAAPLARVLPHRVRPGQRPTPAMFATRRGEVGNMAEAAQTA